MKKWLWNIGLVLCLALPAGCGNNTPSYSEMIVKESTWITSLQKFHWAILDTARPTVGGDYKLTPYFANLAGTALTWNRRDLGAVQDYISWYLTHLNWPDKYGLYGTVYDYYVSPKGVETSTNDYDSADSYAATFLSLVRAYYQAGGNVQYLRDHAYQFNVIGDVMIKLLGADGLTSAKPNESMQYLMDNCEVYKGLTDAAFLFNQVFDDPKDGKWYQSYANTVKAAILTTFGDGNSFNVYVDGDSRTPCDWNIWYPDTVAQVYPIVYGVISPSSRRAQAIFNDLNRFHPGWVLLHTGSKYPWPIIGYAAALLGHTAQARLYINTIKQVYVDKGSPWPWYSGEAGWLLQTMKFLNEHG